MKVNKGIKGEGARCDAQRPREHHSNHDANAWSIQMSNHEEPAPSAPGLEIGNDDAASCDDDDCFYYCKK